VRLRGRCSSTIQGVAVHVITRLHLTHVAGCAAEERAVRRYHPSERIQRITLPQRAGRPFGSKPCLHRRRSSSAGSLYCLAGPCLEEPLDALVAVALDLAAALGELIRLEPDVALDAAFFVVAPCLCSGGSLGDPTPEESELHLSALSNSISLLLPLNDANPGFVDRPAGRLALAVPPLFTVGLVVATSHPWAVTTDTMSY